MPTRRARQSLRHELVPGRRAWPADLARTVRGEPVQRVVARRVEHEPASFDEHHAVGALECSAAAARRRRRRGRARPRDRGAPRRRRDRAATSARRGAAARARARATEARQTRCSSPAESVAVRRSARCPMPRPASAACDARPDLAPARGRCSRGRRRPRSRRAPKTTWSSGSWKSVATVRRAPRDRSPGVAARDLDASLEAAAVEVRDEPGERAQQRRLARARRAEQRDDLARLDRERDVRERRAPARPGTRSVSSSTRLEPHRRHATRTAAAIASRSSHVQAGGAHAFAPAGRSRAPPSPPRG